MTTCVMSGALELSPIRTLSTGPSPTAVVRGSCGRRIREIQDETRRSVRRCIDARGGQAATPVQRDSRRRTPARGAYVKQRAGGTGHAGRACARTVQSIGLDVNDVARAANTRPQGLGERHADARNRNAIGSDTAFDAERRKRDVADRA